MKKIITAALAGSLAFALTGCYVESKEEITIDGEAPAADPAGDVEAACVCDAGKAGETVWCAECSKGYVDGAEKGCEDCVKSKLGGPACPT